MFRLHFTEPNPIDLEYFFSSKGKKTKRFVMCEPKKAGSLFETPQHPTPNQPPV